MCKNEIWNSLLEPVNDLFVLFIITKSGWNLTFGFVLDLGNFFSFIA